MANLCIIPARGGSKRIPRKNIKPFLGKPIIAYSIEAAIKSQLFDEVMVSTDDYEIAQIAEKYGATVPFFRSSENADDYAILADVIKEVISAYKREAKEFEAICCVLPTAPLVSSERLIESYQELIRNHQDTVFPVVEFSYPIQRSLEIVNENIRMVQPQFLKSRSQDLPKRFHDAGQFYWINTSAFLEKNSLFTDNSGPVIISELEAQDIDTELDWKLAEMKFKLLHDLS